MKPTSPQSVKIPLSREGFLRLTQGHPWLFTRHLVEKHPWPTEAAVLSLGEHLFLYSPRADLRLRRLGPSTRHFFDPLPKALTQIEEFRERLGPALKQFLQEAWRRRMRDLTNEVAFRWIFSESDFIPGLIVDRFGDVLCAQIQTAAIEKFWPVLRELMVEVFSAETGRAPAQVIELRQSPYRKKEGLEVISSPEASEIVLPWNGLSFYFQPGGGQKTGSYFDQATNHRRSKEWATKLNLKSAWDLCSFEGGFGLHLAKAGLDVLAVDVSAKALAAATRNAQLNDISPQRFKTEEADVFDFLRQAHTQQQKVDMIVLDPPSFLKSSAQKHSAARGFKELNLRALHCVKKGGLLVSCVCSQNMDRQSYAEILRAAGHDARREVRVLEIGQQSPDHPSLTNFPESNYLQAWYLGVD